MLPPRLLRSLSSIALVLAQFNPALAQSAKTSDARLLADLPAKAGQVALTFDDLPGLTLTTDQTYLDDINTRLVQGLKRHHFPAIGFVNESKLDEAIRARQIANLERWLKAGLDLGNHTFSHESPNDLGAQAYIADIAKGEPVTRGLLAQHHKTMRYFRHPFLETGFPEAAKRAIDQWLAEHHYTIAPVTIDADDWEFAEPYDEALAQHDAPRAARIRQQYLDYTERTVAWYQKASQEVFDRQIAFVMLLHDTRLNADTFDDLAAILKRRRLKPVTLDKAMKDPAYRLRDPYTGKDGIDWLERWADSQHRSMPWALWRDPPKQIEDEYERNNHDRH